MYAEWQTCFRLRGCVMFAVFGWCSRSNAARKRAWSMILLFASAACPKHSWFNFCVQEAKRNYMEVCRELLGSDPCLANIALAA